jgi:hypothetical protein
MTSLRNADLIAIGASAIDTALEISPLKEQVVCGNGRQILPFDPGRIDSGH